MKKNYWHFERTTLMNKLVSSFELELVQNLILFAPRRIGKTEFLEYDLKPMLEANKYKILYFSFFTESDDIVKDFVDYLSLHLQKSIFEHFKIKELSFSWCKVSIDNWKPESWTIVQLLTVLSIQIEKQGYKKLILMLDEVQELQNTPAGSKFISGLRTGLDKNKDHVGVIFTGSSQDGLRRMFDEKKAPFFHFGMNVNMERFGKEFTDFLADQFFNRVHAKLDKDKLFEIFNKLDRVTEYIRHLINILLLEPDLTLDGAYENFTNELFNPEKLEKSWNSLSDVEKGIYRWIKQGNFSFYTDEFRAFMASQISFNDISNSQIQYALNKLLRNQFISQEVDGYSLNNTMLTRWLEQNLQ